MARALIVACGCSGRALGNELAESGWQVRGTSRSPAGLESIADAGLEPAVADPDRPGTLLDLVGDVTVVVWLLGSASGEPEALEAIHGSRLESLLGRLVDTPVRGFAYESVGTVAASCLAAGCRNVEHAGTTWRIPVAMLDRPRQEPGWAAAMAQVVADTAVAR